MLPFLTWRSRFAAMVLRPISIKSCLISFRVTGKPCCAKTCAMPFPMVPAPTMVIFLIATRGAFSTFNDHTACLAPADANCRQSPSNIPPFHSVKKRHKDPRTARPDGVAESDGAAVHVHLVHVQPEHLVNGKIDDGKCFIDFEQIDVAER